MDYWLTRTLQWGVIGPQRQFSHGQMYYGLTFFFLVGAIVPIIQYVLHKKLGWNWLKYVNFVRLIVAYFTIIVADPVISARHHQQI